MFRKIDYGTDKKFEPVRVIIPVKKKYHDWDIIIGKSMLKKEIKSCNETRTILELMKDMNKSIN